MSKLRSRILAINKYNPIIITTNGSICPYKLFVENIVSSSERQKWENYWTNNTNDDLLSATTDDGNDELTDTTG